MLMVAPRGVTNPTTRFGTPERTRHSSVLGSVALDELVVNAINSASLIGKKVAINDAATLLTSGSSMDASIDLPMGASGVQINVHDSQGRLVQELIAGPQVPGTTPVTWNGKDAADNPVPTGLYRMSAVAVVNGQTTPVPVSTLSTVRAISTNPSDGSVSVEVDGGKTLLLSDVKRVGI